MSPAPRAAACSITMLVACSSATNASYMPDAAIDAASDGTGAWGERCGNATDDDGDGLVDEDCGGPFAGVFAPQVGDDPALHEIETLTSRPLSVVQTYHSTQPAGIARIAPDLAAIFARGQVAHLNLEPAGYTPAQYAAPNADPIAHDLDAAAQSIVSALAAAPPNPTTEGRVLLTFGAEMNGNWTDWGCLPAAQYIALYRSAHDRVTAALDTAHIDRRRVRWAYGPNATSSASCGSAAGYYPGHAYVDLLGLSAYRTASDSVDASVVAPMDALFTALAYPPAWRRDRFVVLQTGTRAAADRDAWIATLFASAEADERVAGIIYFDAADWAAPASSLAPAIASAPVADRGLDAIFAPYFIDVPYADPAFPEIQRLHELGITSGCATAPERFCPDDPLRASDATALLANAYPGSHVELADPVMETDLASALVALGSSPPRAEAIVASRRRAAVLLTHAR